MLHGFDPKMSTTFDLMEDGTLCYGVPTIWSILN